MASRNRSREVAGQGVVAAGRKVSTHVILVKQEFMQFSTYFSRTFLLVS